MLVMFVMLVVMADVINAKSVIQNVIAIAMEVLKHLILILVAVVKECLVKLVKIILYRKFVKMVNYQSCTARRSALHLLSGSSVIHCYDTPHTVLRGFPCQGAVVADVCGDVLVVSFVTFDFMWIGGSETECGTLLFFRWQTKCDAILQCLGVNQGVNNYQFAGGLRQSRGRTAERPSGTIVHVYLYTEAFAFADYV